ncbi:MAG TPA: phytoene/squalene synthase family protein [Candidatus Hydrogenedentes bacterium]|nr:phytoene/squalene synthase family protein [Candidatus Hydrogenedentota bacterium]HRK36422.1 phytoene/squalene synthase family protein [Candidatus Hydrogenedentota bacterium]
MSVVHALTRFHGENAWAEQEWSSLESAMRHRVAQVDTDRVAWRVIVREARRVLKTYSTSFFTVTRFLPAHKRAQVEAIYAAVRYPDEIVDAFSLTAEERLDRLRFWRDSYERALSMDGIRAMVAQGVPCFVAAFVQVVRDAKIPPEHYHAFLDAMERDAYPRPFDTLEDLIDSYIYGSAVVVGYFLTHVYDASHPSQFSRALDAARHLGIALQLTNFIRDVGEDQRRGRQYLPLDLVRREGIEVMDASDTSQHEAIARVIRHVGHTARSHYQRAAGNLDAFSPDSRTAIRACIDVYGELNDQILNNAGCVTQRASVPLAQKLRVLPASKYWRLPLAYLGW